MVDSGGGVNHTTAIAMAEFGASGDYDRHLRATLEVYRHRRDVLAGAVRFLEPFGVPDGGWFLWVPLPVRVAELLPRAERHGVSFLPGTHFYAGPDGGGEHYARLAYSMLDDDLLEEGARRLHDAVRDGSA
jgi:DNA-binding transcriptional MocR family regulator